MQTSGLETEIASESYGPGAGRPECFHPVRSTAVPPGPGLFLQDMQEKTCDCSRKTSLLNAADRHLPLRKHTNQGSMVWHSLAMRS